MRRLTYDELIDEMRYLKLAAMKPYTDNKSLSIVVLVNDQNIIEKCIVTNTNKITEPAFLLLNGSVVATLNELQSKYHIKTNIEKYIYDIMQNILIYCVKSGEVLTEKFFDLVREFIDIKDFRNMPKRVVNDPEYYQNMKDGLSSDEVLELLESNVVDMEGIRKIGKINPIFYYNTALNNKTTVWFIKSVENKKDPIIIPYRVIGEVTDEDNRYLYTEIEKSLQTYLISRIPETIVFEKEDIAKVINQIFTKIKPIPLSIVHNIIMKQIEKVQNLNYWFYQGIVEYETIERFQDSPKTIMHLKIEFLQKGLSTNKEKSIIDNRRTALDSYAKQVSDMEKKKYDNIGVQFMYNPTQIKYYPSDHMLEYLFEVNQMTRVSELKIDMEM